MSEKEQNSFFETVPGIITAVGGLVTAIGSLLISLNTVGLLGNNEPAVKPSPESVVKPPPEPVVKPPVKAQKLDDLADRIFYERHPELRGRKILPGETALAQEWNRIRWCEAIVDYTFYERHPELRDRKILPGEKDLAREWLDIKKTINSCR